jgi:hypothetical protein
VANARCARVACAAAPFFATPRPAAQKENANQSAGCWNVWGPMMSALAPEEAKSRPIEINGYAIVSDDDRIGDSAGSFRPRCATKRIGSVSSGRLRALTLLSSAIAATNLRPTSGATNDSWFREARPGSNNAQTSGGGTRRA